MLLDSQKGEDLVAGQDPPPYTGLPFTSREVTSDFAAVSRRSAPTLAPGPSVLSPFPQSSVSQLHIFQKHGSISGEGSSLADSLARTFIDRNVLHWSTCSLWRFQYKGWQSKEGESSSRIVSHTAWPHFIEFRNYWRCVRCISQGKCFSVISSWWYKRQVGKRFPLITHLSVLTPIE